MTTSGTRIVKITDYERYVGHEAIDRIFKKAKPLHDVHITNINSTFYGGGVAELLSSFVPLFNSVGIKTGWRTIQGNPDFFSITKKMHNALQGDEIHLTDLKKEIYEEVVYENAVRNHLHHDFVIVHDPQPLPLIKHYKQKGPWIWRCHIDLTNANQELMAYLKQFINLYDAAIFTLKDYRQDLDIPQVFFEPAIDPFSTTNCDMSENEIKDRLNHYDIPDDLPIVAQISRFDTWKDPKGVIEAFNIARKETPATLVLLGNVATDDPEGEDVYNSIQDMKDERVIILSKQDTSLVNALQRKAKVIFQKSIREGFGLTVTEAMWKGTPVIGGNTGGIRHQIQDGENGFLVSSIEETAARMVQLLKDESLREKLGKKAKETVTERFLLSTYLEKYLDLLNAFESKFSLNKSKLPKSYL